jgi:hypothetical protein
MEALAGHRDAVGLKLEGKLIAAARRSVADGCRTRPYANIAKDRQGCVVERAGARKVGNCEGEVMDCFDFGDLAGMEKVASSRFVFDSRELFALNEGFLNLSSDG